MENMIKIAICDDDKEELKRTRANCVAYAAQYPKREVVISMFDTLSFLLSHIEKKIHLIL